MIPKEILYFVSCLSFSIFLFFVLAKQISELRVSLYRIGVAITSLKSWNIDVFYSRVEFVRFRLHLLIDLGLYGDDTPLLIEQALQGPRSTISFLKPLRILELKDEEVYHQGTTWKFIVEDLSGKIEFDQPGFVRVTWPTDNLRTLNLSQVLDILRSLKEELESAGECAPLDEISRGRYNHEMRSADEIKLRLLSAKAYNFGVSVGALISLVVGLLALSGTLR